MTRIHLNPHRHFDDLNEKWRLCKICALYWPDSELIKDEGGYYCFVCHGYRYDKKRQDAWKPRLRDKED